MNVKNNSLSIIDNSSSIQLSNLEPDFEFSLRWPIIAGIFALVAIFFSLFEVYQHLLYYNKPYLQKYIVRILWMVPIYALNSWFAMFFPSISIYMDTLRECYEAFVIYSFLKYLFNFLYNDVQLNEILIDCKPNVDHLFPFCFLPPMRGGRKFINTCRHGMLQYIVIRPITTFLALFFQSIGVYGEGEFSFRYAYIYLLVINNITQMVAMYCLVIFYHSYKRELAPMKPLGKFLCIKAVVFLSFFQGVLLTILIYIGFITKAFIPSSKDISNYEMSRNLQDFLICFEMLLAAIAHTYVFSHKEFVDSSRTTNPMLYTFTRIIDFTDERTDVYDHFRHIRTRLRDICIPPKNGYINIDDNSAPLIPMETRRVYGGVNEEHANTADFQKL